MTCTTHLLYLHGFRSSPQSAKARQVSERVTRHHPAVRWWCPQLPPSPGAASALIREGVANWPRDTMAVVGSSLGGFYARWLSLQVGCRAALLNPAVHPARDLSAHIGEQTTWQNPEERFFFEPGFVDELRVLEADIASQASATPASADRLFAILAKGDELLDWREMQDFCAGGQVRLLEGSDHALSDFDQHIDALFDFLSLV
ncbi:MAG: esterase [Hydrogenophaga sp.]|uniref:YqiA/YcfP family alpha/beta fold hydrolase n=1 Tax=Hydrogenophaga sp. TaxID=1904254 RepID=UPI001DD8AA4D|nr:YqiA/YcfP family alpha/beta fold hydrolase [Hydrogenophaga sp.]MBX3610657.1 esterase [Hydrogenophaga sp.]